MLSSGLQAASSMRAGCACACVVRMNCSSISCVAGGTALPGGAPRSACAAPGGVSTQTKASATRRWQARTRRQQRAHGTAMQLRQRGGVRARGGKRDVAGGQHACHAP